MQKVRKKESGELSLVHNNIIGLLYAFGPMHKTTLRNLYYLFFGNKDNVLSKKLVNLIEKGKEIKLNYGSDFKFPRNYTGLEKEIDYLFKKGYIINYNANYFENVSCKITKKDISKGSFYFYSIIKGSVIKKPPFTDKIPYYPSMKFLESNPLNYKRLSQNGINFFINCIKQKLYTYREYISIDDKLIMRPKVLYSILKDCIIEELLFYKFGYDIFRDEFEKVFQDSQQIDKGPNCDEFIDIRLKQKAHIILTNHLVLYSLLHNRKKYLTLGELLELARPFIKVMEATDSDGFFHFIYCELLTYNTLQKYNIKDIEGSW